MKSSLVSKKEIAVYVLGFVLLIAGGLFVRAYERAQRLANSGWTNRELNRKLPVEKELKSGKLSNGLQYFIHATDYTEKKAELRLVVNAGSVLETDSQRGLAHAVEHMLFRGTKHFPARSIDAYLTSVGMRSGRDLNAWTNVDETVYTMTIPTESMGVLDTGVAILADMAHRATFDSTEARVEGRIVFEEWRTRQYAYARLSARQDELLMAGSLYAARQTIGDTAILRKFDVAELVAFYRKWYQPENMAIVLVGDFDEQKAESLVRKHFGEIAANPVPVERPQIPVASTNALRVVTLTDPEATNAVVSFNFIRPVDAFRTVGHHRAWVTEMLWYSILERRLEEAADAQQSPLLWTSMDRLSPARPIRTFEIAADIADADVLPAVEALATEIARLKEHGVTDGELRDRREALLSSASESREWGQSPERLASGYVLQFLEGTTPLSYQARYQLIGQVLPTINAADVHASVKSNLDETSALIVVTTPPRGGSDAATVPSDSVILARIHERLRAPTVARTDLADTVSLATAMPAPGSIVSEEYRKDVEAFDIRLSNGMRVLAKQTEFTESGIQFRMIAPGGASLATDANRALAYLSDAAVESMGVGTLSGLRLSRILDTTSISFAQRVSDEAVQFSGYLNTRDLERLFQVLHLKMAAPRADSAAFTRFRAQLLTGLAHRNLDPDVVFEDSVFSATGDLRGSYRLSNPAVIRALTLDSALAFWRARMNNASNFTLTIVGDFSMPQLRNLLTRYLAPLPAGTAETPRRSPSVFPEKTVQRTILAGAGPRARTRLILQGTIDWTVADQEDMEAVTDIAQRAIGEKLREEMGGTYGADVYYTIKRASPSSYRFVVEFESSPLRADSLASAALSELTRLSTSGPTEKELESTQLTMARDYDDSKESNRFWADEISSHAEMGWSLASIAMHQEHFKTFSLNALRKASMRLLSPTRYVRVTMLPVQSSQSTARGEQMPPGVR